MRYTARTDVGQKRENNEDYLFAKTYDDNTALYIVADGLGGYASGEVASKIAVNTIKDNFEQDIDKLNKLDEESQKQALVDFVRIANERVFSIQNSNDKYKGMATTVVLLAKLNGKLYYGSIGDSRLYYIDSNKTKIEQLTVDDTYVNELVRKKIIDKRDVENHPQKHILTKAIGIFGNIDMQMQSLEKENGYVILCSDGLTNMLTDQEILETVAEENVLVISDKLVDKANKNGGTDNITVVVIEI